MASSETGLRVLPRGQVVRFLQERPEAMMALIGELCRRARDGLSLFELRAQHKAGVRLAACLLRLAEKFGRTGEGGAADTALGTLTLRDMEDHGGRVEVLRLVGADGWTDYALAAAYDAGIFDDTAVGLADDWIIDSGARSELDQRTGDAMEVWADTLRGVPGERGAAGRLTEGLAEAAELMGSLLSGSDWSDVLPT